ncbi:MAG: 2-succinyl-6-hydroxy-2,4-cyclohexadiene-carboxylate synthase [Firmicutes bacterium]|nr:2-succinyl-6-hydroxy-2,4-cyclohexadiene-carboxylate synthase [Bacillota bacterium]
MLIPVRDVEYWVEMSGSGKPLVLLHGFTGGHKSWGPYLKSFGQTHRVIAIDLLGHGKSSAPSDAARYSMEQVREDLLALLNLWGFEKIDLLGYSMGGRLALHFAVTARERVEKLVLESASPGIESSQARSERRRADEALAAFIEREGIESFVEYWTQLPLFATQRKLSPEIQAQNRCQRLGNQAQGLANCLRGMGTGVQYSLWDSLRYLTIPTLVLAGALDGKFCSIGAAMQDVLPCGHFMIIPQSGHTIHMEQPELFREAILDFLNEKKMSVLQVFRKEWENDTIQLEDRKNL